jgi:hypothetical protein
MKLTDLQEAKYASPYNVYVYAECDPYEFGNVGFDDRY